jgi:hypothetical protein
MLQLVTSEPEAVDFFFPEAQPTQSLSYPCGALAHIGRWH